MALIPEGTYVINTRDNRLCKVVGNSYRYYHLCSLIDATYYVVSFHEVINPNISTLDEFKVQYPELFI